MANKGPQDHSDGREYSQPRRSAAGESALSSREREIVALVAEGETDQQIANRLFISVRTVGSHLDRIRDKTGCRRRSELTRLAIELEQQTHPERPTHGGDAPPGGQRVAGLGSSNLPQPASSFIGRTSEVGEVRRLVEQVRLVTLVGPGGAGKTRLGIEAASQLLDGSGGGVWLVELAGLSDPETVPADVASVLGVKERPDCSTLDTLVEVLANQNLLVVVDNCEHVIDAVAKLAEAILRSCPRVHLLTTSREPLGVDGEHVYRVPPMSLPPPGVDSESDMAGSEAVALFVERAHAQDRGFALSDDNAALVADVCRRLDGMPLAVELAAARLRSMTLDELHDRLDQRFKLLTSGSRTAAPRQQTLQALIDWSYDLLNGFERTLLRRLPVFAGDFDLDAVEAVCDLGDTHTFSMADLIGSLTDKSLVVADTAGRATRYRMLETIRQYAADLLTRDGPSETERLRQAHGEYYQNLMERAAPHLTGPFQRMWMARLEDAYANLRATIEWLLSHPSGAPVVLRLFGETRAYWWAVSTHDAEAIDQLDRAFSLSPADTPAATRAAALLCKAYMLYSTDLTAQGACAREAAEIAHQSGSPALEAEALALASYNTTFLGIPEEGIPAGRQAVEIARQLGDPVVLADTLLFYAAALKSIDPQTAEAAYREGLRLVNRSGDSGTATLMNGDFADFLLFTGRVDEAAEHLEAALATANVPGSRVADVALGNLGLVHLDRGDVAGGLANFTELLRRARRSGDLAMSGYAALGLACCETAAGHLQRAATLLGGADRLYAMLGSTEWQSKSTDAQYRSRYMAILRSELEADFEPRYETGQTMSRADIIEFALHPQAK